MNLFKQYQKNYCIFRLKRHGVYTECSEYVIYFLTLKNLIKYETFFLKKRVNTFELMSFATSFSRYDARFAISTHFYLSFLYAEYYRCGIYSQK